VTTADHTRTPAEETERLEAEMALLARCVSHDLRQPLHVISGYVELIAYKYRDTLDPKGQQLIGKALAGVERLNTMIDGVVGLMRVDAHSPWEPVVDTEALVDQAIALLQPEAEPQGAKLQRQQLPAVPGHPELLGQVFEHLLRNVLQFPGDGPPRGLVTARSVPEGVRFEVRDQGPGIDPRLHASIFEPFGRGQDPRAGTGMGLAHCRKIVGLHGGALGIDSAAGKGTTFWFTLPLDPQG
jgi:signal transduction histidine kinase